MRVVVWGAGSIGTLLGEHLRRGALQGEISAVTLVCRGARKAAELAKGVRVRRRDPRMARAEPVVENSAPAWAAETPSSVRGRGHADVVLLTTKANHAIEAAAHIEKSGILRPDGNTVVVGLQNGLGSTENVENVLSASARVVQGTTYNGCALWRDAASASFTVDHNGLGRTLFGLPAGHGGSPSKRALKCVAKALSRSGLPCEVVVEEKMRAAVWQKLLVNCVINPLTVLSRDSNGVLAGTLMAGNQVDDRRVSASAVTFTTDNELAAAWRPLAVSVAREVLAVATARYVHSKLLFRFVW